MYEVELRNSVEKKFRKMSKKQSKQLEMIIEKIELIKREPHHYKNLRRPLQHLKRIHIDSSFVLVYSLNEKKKTIIIEDYDHHDKIYK